MKSYLIATLVLVLATTQPSLGFVTGSSRDHFVVNHHQHRQEPKNRANKTSWLPLTPHSTMQQRTTPNQPTPSALSASTSSSSIFLVSKQDVKAVLSASTFFVMDIMARRAFQSLNLAHLFPPSLAACAMLFLAQVCILPNAMIDFLQPGALLFAKWLPVFFVPSLITLPLADTSQLEFAKVAILVSAGFVVSLLSTAATVVLVRRKALVQMDDSTNKNNSIKTVTPSNSNTIPKVAATTTSQPFSNRLVQILTSLTMVSALAVATGVTATFHTPTQGLFLVLVTLTSFVYGSQLNRRIKSILHPLVTCTALTWAAIRLLLSTPLGSTTIGSSSFDAGLRLYQSTAGSLLLQCLGPAVVSLACSMYTRRLLMRDNWRSIVAAIGTSTGTGLLGTAMAVRWLRHTSPAIRLSLLSRNITSPLAMAIAKMVQADVSLAVSMVVVTGLLGANFGATILSIVGIRDPVARGLAVGAAAHGLGTAAMVNEPEAFPFAGAAMALSAFAATITISIPAARNFLIRIAMG